MAPPKDIQEARNAIKAYEQFESWQPTNEKHWLQAHQILMAGLIDDAGRYRKGKVGVMNGEVVVHMAPPANRVKKLMGDLLNWLAAFRERYLKPALDLGLIEMTIPGKPNSRLQQYRLTDQGRKFTLTSRS